jgi:hypothetical protein
LKLGSTAYGHELPTDVEKIDTLSIRFTARRFFSSRKKQEFTSELKTIFDLSMESSQWSAACNTFYAASKSALAAKVILHCQRWSKNAEPKRF